MSQPVSIGRIVHYRLTEDDCRGLQFRLDRAGELCALQVTAVHAGDEINGKVTVDDDRPPLWVKRIPYELNGQPPDGTAGHWHWPPRV